jgi:hypothetical protein
MSPSLVAIGRYNPAMETLSDAALALLHACVSGEANPRVDDTNLAAYRELAAAGIMDPVSGMTRGPEANFRFTESGWASRLEILTSRAGST